MFNSKDYTADKVQKLGEADLLAVAQNVMDQLNAMRPQSLRGDLNLASAVQLSSLLGAFANLSNEVLLRSENGTLSQKDNPLFAEMMEQAKFVRDSGFGVLGGEPPKGPTVLRRRDKEM